MMRYRIAWNYPKVRETFYGEWKNGEPTPLFQREVEELNRKCPGITHWVQIETPATPQSKEKA
jgi:hypothetical protein